MLRWSGKGNVAIWILFVSALTYYPYQLFATKLFSEALNIQVTKNDAASNCSRRSGLFGKPFRSETPENRQFGYCGTIYTDHGGFILPELSRAWRLGVQERSSIDARLQDGKCYEVIAYGFGDTPVRGDPLTNRGLWEIVSVVSEVACSS